MTVHVIHVTDLFICPCKQAQTIHIMIRSTGHCFDDGQARCHYPLCKRHNPSCRVYTSRPTTRRKQLSVGAVSTGTECNKSNLYNVHQTVTCNVLMHVLCIMVRSLALCQPTPQHWSLSREVSSVLPIIKPKVHADQAKRKREIESMGLCQYIRHYSAHRKRPADTWSSGRLVMSGSNVTNACIRKPA